MGIKTVTILVGFNVPTDTLKNLPTTWGLRPINH